MALAIQKHFLRFQNSVKNKKETEMTNQKNILRRAEAQRVSGAATSDCVNVSGRETCSVGKLE